MGKSQNQTAPDNYIYINTHTSRFQDGNMRITILLKDNYYLKIMCLVLQHVTPRFPNFKKNVLVLTNLGQSK